MLRDELRDVMVRHIYHSMLTKTIYAEHTINKSLRQRNTMLDLAFRLRTFEQLFTPYLNRLYRLVKSFNRIDVNNDLHIKEGRKLKTLTSELYDNISSTQGNLSYSYSEIILTADSLLFSLLKAKHYLWRDRLYISILSGVVNDLILEEKHCSLGLWIHGEGFKRFHHLSDFHDFDLRHHLLHKVVDDFLNRELNRLNPHELQTLLIDIEDKSQNLVMALDKLDDKINILNQSPLSLSK
ncbi:hypothetical protein B9P82_23885 [Citrobacter sp. L55]|uniref:CZB domain-containing protein n=1 Tax=Citrobacter sp. L55 TaxID=1981983 RepID=UPI000C776C84|nr:CZB domain-containing protein [Citrobacter sp. L55]PLC60658.1 hypothetical protein B9P82_23885 [Citrobacter sp. L55]